jgi:mannose-6-phosphate isomerase-like protein (cupin superfamily)
MSYLGAGETDAVLAADGHTLVIGASTIRVLADRHLTGGVYSMYAIDIAPDGGGASPHFHRTFAESFQVLAGEVELYDGRGWVEAGPGAHLFIPVGSVHGYRNRSPEPVSLLMLSCPGIAREDYFAELADIVSTGRELTPDEYAEMLARHDQYAVPDVTA